MLWKLVKQEACVTTALEGGGGFCRVFLDPCPSLVSISSRGLAPGTGALSMSHPWSSGDRVTMARLATTPPSPLHDSHGL